MKWLNGFSLAATFEGEFSDVTRSYAGKGVAWRDTPGSLVSMAQVARSRAIVARRAQPPREPVLIRLSRLLAVIGY
jgi:hypothetical protein